MSKLYKNILVTGVSSGLGRAFAVEALRAGYRVIGTVRKAEDATMFEALDEVNAIAKIVDLTDEKGIDTIVSEIEREHEQLMYWLLMLATDTKVCLRSRACANSGNNLRSMFLEQLQL